jgi:hypothetical protein
MKKKIEDALKTEFKELGLSDKTIGRLADYVQGLIEKEEDIATAVKRDDVKLIAKSIQGELDGLKKAKEKAEADLADYKASHPDNTNPDTDPDTNKQTPLTAEAIAELVKNAATEAVKSVKDEFDAYKASVLGKEAISAAKTKFYENKWTTKFQDEANDAWERAHELNEAGGSKMSQEELTAKATEYFNLYVKRKGTDATKPFEDDGSSKENFDFSGVKERLQGEGKLPKDQQ